MIISPFSLFLQQWRLHPCYYDYFYKFLLLEKVVIFKTRQNSLHS